MRLTVRAFHIGEFYDADYPAHQSVSDPVALWVWRAHDGDEPRAVEPPIWFLVWDERE